MLNINRCQFPSVTSGCDFQLLNSRARPALGQWHTVEIGTYKNELEFWIDGSRYLKYSDPVPVLDGTISLAPRIPLDEKDVVYFDNFSVCELTAPLGAAPTPES